MDKNQKINCTVHTCKYNNSETKRCQLENIVVTPMPDCNTKTPDESMCSSYDYDK